MSYLKMLKKIEGKQVAPVILIYGTESYFIQNLQKQLTKSLFSETQEDVSSYDLEETPIQEVITDVETYPFFGERKLIIANNPTFLKAKPDKLPFEHDLEALQRYINSPVDYSTIVFIAPYEKIDERKKISKLLKKEAMLGECAPIKEYEVTNWIKSLASDLKVSIASDAYEVFENELSTNLYLLKSEITKLAMFVGENGIVTKEIAEELISHSASSSALRLVDAVIERNLHKAITIFKDLEKAKEEPIALIALLAFQFRIIFQVKLLKQKGYSQAQMQKQLKVHPYVVKIAFNREKQFTTQKLTYIFDKLTKADAMTKQGKMEKYMVFELLLYELTQSV